MSDIYSPAKSRADRIQQQLSGITFSHHDQVNILLLKLYFQKAQRIQDDEERLTLLEQGVKDLKDTLAAKLTQIQEAYAEVEKLVKDSKTQDEDPQKATQDLRTFEQTATKKVEDLAGVRQEAQKQFVAKFDEEINTIRQQIQEEVQQRNANIEALDKCLEADLPALLEKIREDETQREQVDVQIQAKLQDELHKIAEVVQQERVARQESEAQVFEMLKEVVNRIKAEIDQERVLREATEHQILTLLDNTVNKISSAQQ